MPIERNESRCQQSRIVADLPKSVLTELLSPPPSLKQQCSHPHHPVLNVFENVSNEYLLL